MAKRCFPGTLLYISGVKDGFGNNRTVDIFWIDILESNRDRKEYIYGSIISKSILDTADVE